MEDFSCIAAVIRSYNNKHIVGQVKAYLKMGLGRVIVVVNAAQDKGATPAWLRQIRDDRLQVIELHEGYSWSSGLNAGLMALELSNYSRKAIEFVFNVSVEAKFETSDIQEMLEQFEQETVGVVGTSFDGRLDGNSVDLGRSYRHPRNTGMMIRLGSLPSFRGFFDPWCDQVGGMEDIDFVFRMTLAGAFSYKMLDLQVRLILGKHYDQETKEVRERKAMDKIISRARSVCRQGSPEISRVETAIVEMALE